MTEAVLSAPPVAAPVAAPDTPSARVPSSWRGVTAEAGSEGRRWTFIEISMMAWNALMMAWLMYVVMGFGGRDDQSDPVGVLAGVFGVWLVGTVVVFLALSFVVRLRGAPREPLARTA